jgi:hypothetical protein
MINSKIKTEVIQIIENMAEDYLLKLKRLIEREIYPSVKPFMKVSYFWPSKDIYEKALDIFSSCHFEDRRTCNL